MRKESSTNLENEAVIHANCGMAYTVSLIGGRWKLPVLGRLAKAGMRYSQLRKTLPQVSERMLIMQLRELEHDGLISRFVHPGTPTKVEYSLTTLGVSLKPVLKMLSDWGEDNRRS